jgi:hypothetical protein
VGASPTTPTIFHASSNGRTVGRLPTNGSSTLSAWTKFFLGVVQLAEHLCDTQKVRGSIPRAKTNADAARWNAHLPPKQDTESSILSIGTMLVWSSG